MRRAHSLYGYAALMLTLTLAACQGEQSSQDISSFEAFSEDIAQSFQANIQPSLMSDLAAQTVSRPDIELTHLDPLVLPDSTLKFAGSDTLSPVTADIISDFYDEGFRGTMIQSQSATGVGMRALCGGEDIQIVNASRLMRDSERALCRENGVSPIMVKVGYDPFVLLTHSSNADLNRVEPRDLPRIFGAKQWSDINPAWPAKNIAFYLPSHESGAMYAMSEFVYGDPQSNILRETPAANFYSYNLELTRDLAEDENGLGFASFGKLAQINRMRAKIVPIGADDPITAGSAYPLRRSLYLVTSEALLTREDVQTFLAFYLNQIHTAMPEQGFAPIDGVDAERERGRLIAAINRVSATGEDSAVKRIEN